MKKEIYNTVSFSTYSPILVLLFTQDWYVSSVAQDTPSCGESASSGCRTLDHLLDRVYQTSPGKLQTLSIVIDTNLSFTDSIVVSTI